MLNQNNFDTTPIAVKSIKTCLDENLRRVNDKISMLFETLFNPWNSTVIITPSQVLRC